MSKRSYWIGLLLFFASLPTFATKGVNSWKETPPEEWISKALTTWVRPGAKCYLYNAYWVTTLEHIQEVGSDIFVFKRNNSAKFPESCDLDAKKALLQYRDDDYSKVAIHDDILFLDSGSSHWRGLQIIALNNKKQIATMGYNGSVGKFSFVGDEFIYRGPLEATDNDRPQWQIIKKCVWGPQNQPKEWFQEHYSGTQRVNLKTGKSTTTEVTCEVGQAAG